MSQIVNSEPGTKCLRCGVEFVKRVHQSGHSDGKLHKGMIMICSACSQPHILGDSDWRPLTREDFAKLAPIDQKRLLYTAQMLKAKAWTKKPWTPYDPPQEGKN